MSKVWGMSLHVDLSKCNHNILKDQKSLREFIPALCRYVDMVPHGKPIVDRFGDGDIEGVSGMMFIKTSSISVHNDEVANRAFVDLFTCKKFDVQKALEFIKHYYKTSKINYWVIDRG